MFRKLITIIRELFGNKGYNYTFPNAVSIHNLEHNKSYVFEMGYIGISKPVKLGVVGWDASIPLDPEIKNIAFTFEPWDEYDAQLIKLVPGFITLWETNKNDWWYRLSEVSTNKTILSEVRLIATYGSPK